MKNLKILNKKEIKRILAKIEDQWGFTGDLDYVFLLSEKGRLYIAKREIFDLDYEKVRVNSLGIYFADMQGEFRLSIEGSQMIGPEAKKNVLEINDEQNKAWMRGEDLDIDTDMSGHVIIKHDEDYIGTGKVMEKKGKKQVLNYVPKVRRAEIIN